MKTIAEINEIAPYKANEWQEGYGIWQQGYMQGQKDAATEQKSIDIDKACEWLSHRLIPYEGFSFEHLVESFRKAMEE